MKNKIYGIAWVLSVSILSVSVLNGCVQSANNYLNEQIMKTQAEIKQVNAQNSQRYFVEGGTMTFHIDGDKTQVIRYQQYNQDNVNTSNRYFSKFGSLWMGARNPDNTTEQLGITLYKLPDLATMRLPFVIDGAEAASDSYAVLTWKPAAQERQDKRCQGVDAGCAYVASTQRGDWRITIEAIDGKKITGYFSGEAVMQGMGYSRWKDESSRLSLTDGRFEILFR